MCFSATADVVGGLAIGTIGVDVLRHLDGRRAYGLVAALPLLFALHQLDEAFVWWGLEGHVPAAVGHVATWIYLLFAFVVLPVYVPVALVLAEPERSRRLLMIPFVVLGTIVAGVLLAAMIRGPVTAELGHFYLHYSTDLQAVLLIVSFYVAATCGSLLVSSIRHIAWFGLVNLTVVAVLARLTIHGFASLWCAWAAMSSAALAVHLRAEHRGSLVPIQPSSEPGIL